MIENEKNLLLIFHMIDEHFFSAFQDYVLYKTHRLDFFKQKMKSWDESYQLQSNLENK
jgi:hypothetical protein